MRCPTALLLLHFLLTARFVSADNSLQITFPTTRQEFKFGSRPTFFFESSWPNITLEIWQGPDDQGRVASRTLLPGVSGYSNSNYTWTPRVLTDQFTRDVPFHLFLYATNKYPNCNDCSSNSSTFTIYTNDDRQAGRRRALRIGLGVGLGVGIPLVAGLAGLATWFCMRRRRQYDDNSSQSMPLQPRYDDWTRSPGTTNSAGGYVSSIDQKQPLESGGHDIAELPQNQIHAPVEVANDREAQELPGNEIDMQVAKAR